MGIVYWDSLGLQSQYSGVGRHACDLNLALRRLGLDIRILPSRPDIDPYYTSTLSQTLTPFQKMAIFKIKPLSLWQASRQILALKPGIIHGLSNFNLPETPKGSGWKHVLTVHDLIPLLKPRLVSRSLEAYMRWQLPRSLARADAIICISRWTRDILESRYPDTKSRLFVIPNGISQLNLDPRKMLSGIGQGDSPILLTISRDEPYKRLELIPEVLRRLPSKYQWVVVCDENGRKKLEGMAGDLGDRLKLYCSIDEETLESLYQSSKIYVHPSLWEGFCLPAAKAIQFGRPVLFVSGSGIDESVAEAGRGLSAGATVNEWAESILSIEQGSEDWAKICDLRCRHFATWDEVAAQTRRLYGMLD